MAVNLDSVTLTLPSSDPNIETGQSFTMRLTTTHSGHGGDATNSLHFEYSTDDVNFNDITGATGLSTANTNPVTWNSGATTWDITVDGDTADTYYVRGRSSGADGPYTTASQVVTVTAGSTINNKTLQDLDSCACDDSIVPLRLRDRETADTELSNLVTDAIQRYKHIDRILTGDYFPVHGDALVFENVFSTKYRVRVQLTSDNELSNLVTDDKTATYVPYSAGPTINEKTLQDLDSCAVTDAAVMLRERNREQTDNAETTDASVTLRERNSALADSLDANDAEALLRERNRSQADTLDVEDVRSQWIENNQEQTETLDPTDDAVEQRERNRTSSDSLATETDDSIEQRQRNRALADSIEVNDFLAGPVITTVLFDSIAVDDVRSHWIENNQQQTETIDPNDDAVELRERNRALADDIAVTDDIIVVSSGVKSVTLQDLDSCAVTDDAIELRERNREQTDSAAVEDVSTGIRLVEGEEVETIDTADDSTELRERNRALFDDAAVTDAVDATYVPDAGGPTINDRTLQDLDSVAVNDINEQLRERARQTGETADITDATAEYRTRTSLDSDSITATDQTAPETIRARQTADSIDLSETVESVRERLRALSDTISISDAVIVTLDQEITTRTLTDSLAVTDALTAQRIVIPPQFIVNHDIEELNVLHDIETYNIVHRILQETGT